MKPIFDTQLAHSFILKKICRNCLNISYCNLGKDYNLPAITNKKDLYSKYAKNPLFWGKRPLTKELKIYATDDVRLLIAIQAQQKVEIDEEMLSQFMDQYRNLTESLVAQKEQQNLTSIKRDKPVTKRNDEIRKLHIANGLVAEKNSKFRMAFDQMNLFLKAMMK